MYPDYTTYAGKTLHISRAHDHSKVYCSFGLHLPLRVPFTYGTSLLKWSSVLEKYDVHVCETCVEQLLNSLSFILSPTKNPHFSILKENHTHSEGSTVFVSFPEKECP